MLLTVDHETKIYDTTRCATSVLVSLEPYDDTTSRCSKSNGVYVTTSCRRFSHRTLDTETNAVNVANTVGRGQQAVYRQRNDDSCW